MFLTFMEGMAAMAVTWLVMGGCLVFGHVVGGLIYNWFRRLISN